MTLQPVYGATVAVLAFGVVTVGPAYAQRRDGNLLPQEQEGQVVAVGCLVRGTDVRGGKEGKYVLARPKRGPVASVPEASCTADAGADALMVDNPEKGKSRIRRSAAGWRSAAGSRRKPARTRTTFVSSTWRRSSWCRSSSLHHRQPAGGGTDGGGTATDPAGRQRRLNPQRQPQSLAICRRRRASFQGLDWPGCSRLRQASRFVRSDCSNEGDALAPDLLTPRPPGRAVTPDLGFR